MQIFVHILKGEKIINEAIAKEKEEQLKNPAARAPASTGLHGGLVAGAHSIQASGSQGPADDSARLAVLLASMSEGMDAEIERALQEPTPEPRSVDQSLAAARAGDRLAASAAAALTANGASQVRSNFTEFECKIGRFRNTYHVYIVISKGQTTF